MDVIRRNVRHIFPRSHYRRQNARADTTELCLARLKAWYIPAQWQRLGENDHHRPLRPERATYIRARAGFEIRSAYKTIAKTITRAGLKPRPCKGGCAVFIWGQKMHFLSRTLIRFFRFFISIEMDMDLQIETGKF
jgi:hypothetical protein